MNTTWNWEDFKEFIKGKVFLVGLTFVDDDGNMIEQYQTHGVVDELTDDGLLRFRRKDGSIFQMPYDPDTMSKLDQGEYREKSTGQIIIDPDFMMTWEIITTRNDNLESVKKHGYIPGNVQR